MIFWVGLGFVWLGTAASVAFLFLYLMTARWWDSMVGVSLVSHAAAMVALFSVSAAVTTTAGPVELSPVAFTVTATLSLAELLQATVFYRRWWREKKAST